MYHVRTQNNDAALFPSQRSHRTIMTRLAHPPRTQSIEKSRSEMYTTTRFFHGLSTTSRQPESRVVETTAVCTINSRGADGVFCLGFSFEGGPAQGLERHAQQPQPMQLQLPPGTCVDSSCTGLSTCRAVIYHAAPVFGECSRKDFAGQHARSCEAPAETCQKRGEQSATFGVLYNYPSRIRVCRASLREEILPCGYGASLERSS